MRITCPISLPYVKQSTWKVKINILLLKRIRFMETLNSTGNRLLV